MKGKKITFYLDRCESLENEYWNVLHGINLNNFVNFIKILWNFYSLFLYFFGMKTTTTY